MIQGRIHSAAWSRSPQLTGAAFAHISADLIFVLRTGSSLCAEGLLQDPRQHCAPPWDRGAPFHRLLWMPWSAASHKHTFCLWCSVFFMCSCDFACLYFLGLFSGELPECTQDLMIDVTKSYYQKFLPLSQIWVVPQSHQLDAQVWFPSPHTGSPIRLKWTLRSHLLSLCSYWPWVSLPKEKHLFLLKVLM